VVGFRLGRQGFVNWAAFEHPTLGPVEIGGFAPFAKILPPADQIEKHIAFPVDFYLKLMNKIATLAIKDTRVKSVSEGLYAHLFSDNPGLAAYLVRSRSRAGPPGPLPFASRRQGPDRGSRDDPSESVPFIGGGETRKVEWTFRAKAWFKVQITANLPSWDGFNPGDASVTKET